MLYFNRINFHDIKLDLLVSQDFEKFRVDLFPRFEGISAKKKPEKK